MSKIEYLLYVSMETIDEVTKANAVNLVPVSQLNQVIL